MDSFLIVDALFVDDNKVGQLFGKVVKTFEFLVVNFAEDVAVLDVVVPNRIVYFRNFGDVEPISILYIEVLFEFRPTTIHEHYILVAA